MKTLKYFYLGKTYEKNLPVGSKYKDILPNENVYYFQKGSLIQNSNYQIDFESSVTVVNHHINLNQTIEQIFGPEMAHDQYASISISLTKDDFNQRSLVSILQNTIKAKLNVGDDSIDIDLSPNSKCSPLKSDQNQRGIIVEFNSESKIYPIKPDEKVLFSNVMKWAKQNFDLSDQDVIGKKADTMEEIDENHCVSIISSPKIIIEIKTEIKPPPPKETPIKINFIDPDHNDFTFEYIHIDQNDEKQEIENMKQLGNLLNKKVDETLIKFLLNFGQNWYKILHIL